MRFISWLWPGSANGKSAGDEERALSADLLLEGWGLMGGATASGKHVGRRLALQLGAIWRGVNLISNDVAKLPLHLYERTADDERVRVMSEPAAARIVEPNRYMTAFTFRRFVQFNAMTAGNGYAWINRDNGGRPLELLPIDGERVDVELNGFEPRYVIVLEGFEEAVSFENMIHISGIGYQLHQGASMISFGAEEIGLAAAAREHSSSFFANDATPRMVLEHPDQLSDNAKKALRAAWEKTYGGSRNAFKTAILEEGMKVHTMSATAKDSELNATRLHETRELANFIGVPPHLLGDPNRTSFASLEQENQSYLDRSLDPWLVQWEEELAAKLLTVEQRRDASRYFEFQRAALVRADTTARFNAYAQALQAGWMTRNEVRKRENLPPLDGGDDLMIPLNQGPGPAAGGGGAAGAPEPDDGGADDAASS